MNVSAEILKRVLALDVSPAVMKEMLAIVVDCQQARPVSSNAQRQADYRARMLAAKVTETITPVTTNATHVVTPTESARNENVTLDVTTVTPDPSRVGAFFMGEEVKEESKEESKKEKVLLTQDSLPEVGNPDVIDLKTKKNEIAMRERRAELQAFGEQWNVMAARLNLKCVEFIRAGSGREKQAMARLQELRNDYHANIEKLLGKIASSPFLSGRSTDFKACFDWVIKSANFTKIMEGNYEDQKRGHQGLNGRPYQRA